MLSGAAFRATALSIALLAAFPTPPAVARPARQAPSSELSGYEFGYATSGSPQVSPVQVFDDGHSTYFQFHDMTHIPAIIRLDGDRRMPVPHQIKPPYVVINEVGDKYLLQLGRQTALVDRIGSDASAPDAAPEPPPLRSRPRRGTAGPEPLFPDVPLSAPDWQVANRTLSPTQPPRFHTGLPDPVPAPSRSYPSAGRPVSTEPGEIVQDEPVAPTSAGMQASPINAVGMAPAQNTDQMRLQVIQNTLNLLGTNRISQDLAANVIRQAANAAPASTNPWSTATNEAPAYGNSGRTGHKQGRAQKPHSGKHPKRRTQHIAPAAAEPADPMDAPSVPVRSLPVQRAPVQYEGQPIAEYTGFNSRQVQEPARRAPTRNSYYPSAKAYSGEVGNLDVQDSAWKPEWLPSKPLILRKARSMSHQEAYRYVQPFLKANVQFTVRENEKLSEAIRALAIQNDWRLEWETDKDFTVLYGYTVTGDSLEYVLQKALASYGLQAILYSVNRVIVIKPLNDARTVG